MKVLSFMRLGSELAPVEVEVTLPQGLPQFHFMGLPDTALKESGVRIRAALKEQSYTFPNSNQILVHLKPTHQRKTSQGLDLAIAAAILWESGQLPLPEGPHPPVLYGELTLKGEVVCPDDTIDIPCPDGVRVYTGVDGNLSFPTLQLRNLDDLKFPQVVHGTDAMQTFERPAPSVPSFSETAARVAMVVAAGEHAALFAGPPGSGKSTLAHCIPAWIDEPDVSEMKLTRRLWRQMGNDLKWRPVLRPHSSATPLAMIGGGNTLYAGEITRAHGGVLIMDELLEFHAEIQEALREPIESGVISLVRGGKARTYPARLLLLATTNLCPCGKFVPRRNSLQCRCAKLQRRKSLTRLTGPFVDRFAIFSLTDEWEEGGSVSVTEIAESVSRAVEFRKVSRSQSVPNSRLMPEVIEQSLTEFQRTELLTPAARSRRRRAALLQVARTIADLRESSRIDHSDLEEAIRLSVRSHRLLEEWQE